MRERVPAASRSGSTTDPPAGGRPPRRSAPRRLFSWLADGPFHLPRLPRVLPRRRRAGRGCSRAGARHRPRRPALRPAARPAAGRPAQPAAREPRPASRSCSSSPRPTRAPRCTASTYLDYVGIKQFDADGAVTGEKRFLGLFASSAYTESDAARPDHRRAKVQAVLRARRVHRRTATPARTSLEVLENYPRDELFQTERGGARTRSRPRCCTPGAPQDPAVPAQRRATAASCRA